MNKRKNIIFTAFLVACLSGAGTAYADLTLEPQIDANNMLKMAGRADEGNTPVTVEIYETGKSFGSMDLNNLADTFYYIRETISDISGNYELEVPLRGAGKAFTVRVKEGEGEVIERKINFENSLAQSALSELKAAKTTAEIKSAADKFSGAVEFDFELYSKNKTAIESSALFYEIIGSIKDDKIKNQSDFVSVSEYASVMYALANAENTSAFKEIFDKYSGIVFKYNPECSELYNNEKCVSNTVKEDIMQRLFNANSKDGKIFADSESFNKLLRSSIILSCCEKNRGYDGFDAVLDALAEIYKGDSSFMNSYRKYQSYSQSKKNETALEIMGDSFSDTDAVRDEFIKATEKKQSTGSSTGGGGGGGGGGSTGGFRALPENIPSVEDAAVSKPSEPENNVSSVFSDLGDVKWAEESILKLASRSIVNGKGNGIFAPHDLVTREEFVKMLVNALGITTGKDKCGFSDVPEDAWYYEYVAAGYANGIVNGIDDSIFGQGRFVSRQDIAAMAGRAMEKLGVKMGEQASDAFSDDGLISDYAKETVYSLKAMGVINGKGNNAFDPLGNATRAEAAKIKLCY